MDAKHFPVSLTFTNMAQSRQKVSQAVAKLRFGAFFCWKRPKTLQSSRKRAWIHASCRLTDASTLSAGSDQPLHGGAAALKFAWMPSAARKHCGSCSECLEKRAVDTARDPRCEATRTVPNRSIYKEVGKTGCEVTEGHRFWGEFLQVATNRVQGWLAVFRLVIRGLILGHV